MGLLRGNGKEDGSYGLGFRVAGLIRGITQIIENQMEKNGKSEMETGVASRGHKVYGPLCAARRFRSSGFAV